MYLTLMNASLVSFLVLFLSLVIVFFNDPATTEIYPLSLHDALPISVLGGEVEGGRQSMTAAADDHHAVALAWRSEEHTSELQSHVNLVCRLLLEKKNNKTEGMVDARTKSAVQCSNSANPAQAILR